MLEGIPSGRRVFVDSNIFIYHFLDLSDRCTVFLERISAHQLRGFTSTVVMAEVLHKLMIAEVAENYKLNRREVNQFIKRCPSVISELERCEAAIQQIPEFNIEILPLMSGIDIESRNIRHDHNLMTNDSINLFLMKLAALEDIATNDSDFDRIPWIRVWKPH